VYSGVLPETETLLLVTVNMLGVIIIIIIIIIRNSHKILVVKLKERDQSEDLDVAGRIILK
jgi:hypothetical protein